MIEKLFQFELTKLKEELIYFYGDESEDSFKEHLMEIKEFIKEGEFTNNER